MSYKINAMNVLAVIFICFLSVSVALSEEQTEFQHGEETEVLAGTPGIDAETENDFAEEPEIKIPDIDLKIDVETIKDGFAMFGSLSVGPNELRRGDMVVMGGTADVAGKLTGDMVVLGGTANVSGYVRGDVVVIGGVINLASTARVDGDVTAVGGVIHREEGAVILGQSVSVAGRDIRLGRDMHRPDLRVFRHGFRLSLLLTWLVVAFVISLIFTRPIENTVETAFKRPIESIFTGFVFHTLILLTCLILTVIVIGIPLALLGILLWLMISVFGTSVGFVMMGRLIVNKLNKSHASIVIVLIIGFAILALVRQTPFFIGWTIWQLWGMTGIGATVLSRFGTNKPWFGNRKVGSN